MNYNKHVQAEHTQYRNKGHVHVISSALVMHYLGSVMTVAWHVNKRQELLYMYK